MLDVHTLLFWKNKCEFTWKTTEYRLFERCQVSVGHSVSQKCITRRWLSGVSIKPLHSLPCHLLQLVPRWLHSGTSEQSSCLIPRVLQLRQRKLRLGWGCNETLNGDVIAGGNAGTVLGYAYNAGRFRFRPRFRQSAPVVAKNVLCLTLRLPD